MSKSAAPALDKKQSDLFRSRALRDEGIAKVASRADVFMDAAMAALREYARFHREFIGEDFRVHYLLSGGAYPHHPNAWGALMNAAARRGFIAITDRNVQMRVATSHARRSPVWRSLVYAE